MKNTLLAIKCLVLLSIIALFTTSCKKEKFEKNATGKTVLSDQDLLGLHVIDTTITIHTYPVIADSVRTDEIANTILLGSYVDPVLGKTEASLFCEFTYVNPLDIIGTVVFDSIILSFPLEDYYGTIDPQTFEVYQMSERIFYDSTYYSNSLKNTLSNNIIEVGKESITPNLTNGFLNIRLDESFGLDLFSQTNTSTFDSKENFKSWFKGLYIKTNTSQISNQGSILTLANVGLITFYYKNTFPTNNQSLPLGQKAFQLKTIPGETAYFNHYEHDYTSTTVESALNDASLGNNEFYIKPMGGLNTEVIFPHISNFSSTEGFTVRKAELILPYIDNSTYNSPESLIPLTYNEQGDKIFIVDQFISNVGGERSVSNKNYVFNITNYVNELILGKQKENKLLIAPVGASIKANRAVFNGQKSINDQKIKLKISYTIF